MRKILLILLLFTYALIIGATEQVPDQLIYNGKKISLYTGWGHPSPLQTYFQQNDIKYPFTMLSTANYRGHIATWEIKDNKFLLNEIKVRDDIYKPEKYDIKSISDTIIPGGRVLADWFSGVLQCSTEKQSYYFYIRYGEVIDEQVITEKDFKKIQNLSEKDTTNHELMRKYSMLYLNQNYISYYFRLSSEDKISNGDKSGRFITRKGFSPILGYFGNDHMKWPYNWENFEKSGAPDCIWTVEKNKVYLAQVGLRTGTGFYEVTRFEVPLDELFPTGIDNIKVYADWLTGIYMIQHGEEKEDTLLPGFTEFKIDNITYVRIINGLLIEEYTVPADYTRNGIPEDADSGLKKILEELQ
ncbi:hypothetical protein M2451_000827 [Dysgonomonas sp. PFB1-18]|uniref:hypothetical protein n=1 Tax=unclassified Dysgonomonas TaxID=2630389 RepID=UPI0024733759|nr:MULTISPECIES: hypothetical protein [unclassified Dysgonomonas]MDH6308516.1 hypothetical protein [Dysgonomonas sp. PF1-14]MDH6338017.1 hypothetical protein [Dysgonomonas sp. PF1-16]MDH6379514.1 hypothetical protein [Dysgonomonas sp. PFB1-18]MDH6396844.1 hypothetical protein [Dysgonomonas sp. PF1-23]